MEICKRCGGSGWIIIERNGVSAAERCEDCKAHAMAARRYDTANIPLNYENADFENFSARSENPIAYNALLSIMAVVRNYARDFPTTEKPGLLLVGDTGTGKTHLAIAAMKALMRRGFDGVFFDYNNLLDRIRASYDAASASSDRNEYRMALDAEILLLDDLGAHRATDWVEDILTSIITYRCNNRKAVIATTNLAEPDAGSAYAVRKTGSPTPEYRTKLSERIGARARSRLFEMCHVVKLPDIEDYRILKKRLEGMPRM